MRRPTQHNTTHTQSNRPTIVVTRLNVCWKYRVRNSIQYVWCYRSRSTTNSAYTKILHKSEPLVYFQAVAEARHVFTAWRTITTTTTMPMLRVMRTTFKMNPTTTTKPPPTFSPIWSIRCNSVPSYSYYCYSLCFTCCCRGGYGNNISTHIPNVTRGRPGVPTPPTRIVTLPPHDPCTISSNNYSSSNNIVRVMRVLPLDCRYVPCSAR